MTLPSECIQHIVSFVPARWRLFTLHSLLLLNTDFMNVVVPILYADPCKTLQQHYAATQRPSPWRRRRLLATLVACIDTTSTLRGLAQEPHTIITPALMLVLRRVLVRMSKTPKSSINYLEHMAVHALPSDILWPDGSMVLQPWIRSEVVSESLQRDLQVAQATILQWVAHGLHSTCHRSVHALRPNKWYWPAMAFWTEPPPSPSPSPSLSSSSSSLHHQVMFPHLQSIDIQHIEPASQPHLIQFVQQHQAAFPGVLSRLAMAVRNLDHSFSMTLLKSFGGSLRNLEIYSWPWQIDLFEDGGQIAVPERLERLILPPNIHPLHGMDKYLFRLERLEMLGVSVETDYIFTDARKRKLTKQEVPLRRLRHLMLESYTSRTRIISDLEDAIIAFGEQLESLVVKPSFVGLNQDDRVSWAEPEAVVLATTATAQQHGLPMPMPMPNADAIATIHATTQAVTFNPANSQEASMDDMFPNMLNLRLTHVYVKTYLPALRVLHLNDMIALHFSMWSLAACPSLESLTLDISKSFRTMYSHEHEALFGRTGNWAMCCVPNLRELHLLGSWRISYRTLNAMVTQQQVDVVWSDPIAAAAANGSTTASTAAAAAAARSLRSSTRRNREQYTRRLPLRKLQVLDASGAQALTALEIGRLVGKLPSLREIVVAVRADEKENLKLWTKQHGRSVDVRSLVRTFESEYDTVV